MIAVNIRSQSEEIQYIRERFEMIDNKSVLCFNADLIVISVFFYCVILAVCFEQRKLCILRDLSR